MAKSSAPYSPAARLAELKSALYATGGLDIYEIAERFEVAERTAIRLLRALENSGERLYFDLEGTRRIWRLTPSGREHAIPMTVSQIISLYLARELIHVFRGTQLHQDLDEVFEKLGRQLARKDFGRAGNLERKLRCVGDVPFSYEDNAEEINDIITALVREERVDLTYRSEGKRARTFRLDPLSLVTYRQALYLVGFNHEKNEIRTYGFDRIKRVTWRKGDRYEYPRDYDPDKLHHGAFGLRMGGEVVRVRLWFSERVARFARRRKWHPTQKVKSSEDGIEMTFDVVPTPELRAFILGWGRDARVLEPEHLRQEISSELAAAAKGYD